MKPVFGIPIWKMARSHLPAAVFSVLLLSSIGCATMQDDWKNATEIDSPESYEEFLKEWPNSPYAGDARTKKMQADWIRADDKNTSTSYWTFLQQYPDSPHTREAMTKKRTCEFVEALSSLDPALSDLMWQNLLARLTGGGESSLPILLALLKDVKQPRHVRAAAAIAIASIGVDEETKTEVVTELARDPLVDKYTVSKNYSEGWCGSGTMFVRHFSNAYQGQALENIPQQALFLWGPIMLRFGRYATLAKVEDSYDLIQVDGECRSGTVKLFYEFAAGPYALHIITGKTR